ncbi:unnamed protein product, partial [Closterium sp. Naga37s-1]
GADGKVGGEEEDTDEAETEALGQWQAQGTMAGLLGVAGREAGASAVLQGGSGESEGAIWCDADDAEHAGVAAGQACVGEHEEGVRAREVERGAEAAQEGRMGAAERVVGCEVEGEESDGRGGEEDSSLEGQSGGAGGEQQCEQGGHECAEEWWQYGEGEGRGGVEEKVAMGGRQEAGRCVVETAGRDGVVEAMEDDACMGWGGQGMWAALVGAQKDEKDSHTREHGGERSRGVETEWEGGVRARTEEEGMHAGVGRGEAVSAKVEEWERWMEEAKRGGDEVWQAGLCMTELCSDAHATLAQGACSMGALGRGALQVDKGGAGVWVESGVGEGGAGADGCGEGGCVAVGNGVGVCRGQGSMEGVTQGQDEDALGVEQGRREGLEGLNERAAGEFKALEGGMHLRVLEGAGLVVMCDEDPRRHVTAVKVEKDEEDAKCEKDEEVGLEAQVYWCAEAEVASQEKVRTSFLVAAEMDESVTRRVSVEGLREECEEEVARMREEMRRMEVVVVREEMARRRQEGGEMLIKEGRGAIEAERGRLQVERDRLRAEEEGEDARTERDCCVKSTEDMVRARDEAERRVEALHKPLLMGTSTENEVQGGGQVTIGESVDGGEKRGIGEDMAWSEMMHVMKEVSGARGTRGEESAVQERGVEEMERRCRVAEEERDAAKRRKEEAEEELAVAVREGQGSGERAVDEAEEERMQAERAREEADRQRDEAERRREEGERKRKEDARKRAEAERGRQEAEKKREEEERRRQEAERRREEAERRRDEAESRIEAERKKEAEWEKEEAERRSDEAERRSEEAERRREEVKREKEEAERRKDEAERSRDEKERVDAERDNVCSRREKAAHGMRVEEEVACAREVGRTCSDGPSLKEMSGSSEVGKGAAVYADGVGVAGLGEEVACSDGKGIGSDGKGIGSDVHARAHAGCATARPAALHARERNSALGVVLAGSCALGGSSNGHDTSNDTTGAVMGGGPARHTTATPCAADTTNANTASSATAASTCSRSAHTSHVPHNWHGSYAHGSHASHSSHTSLSSHASHAPAPGSCHSSPPFVPAHAAELTTTCSCAADTPIGPVATVAAEVVQPETSSEAPAVTASTNSHSSSCPPSGGGPPHTMLAARAPTPELLLSRQHLRKSPPALAAATDVVVQIRAGEVSWSRQVREVQGKVQRAAAAWAHVERRAGLVEETARQLVAEVERAEEKRRLAEEEGR